MRTNLTKRIVGLLVTLSLMLTYAVPFAFAGESVSAETLWTFESLLGDGDTVLSEDTDLNGLTIHATAEKTITINASKKDVDDLSFTARAKFGGKCDSAMSYRSMSFVPAQDGTVTVYYAHASANGEPRILSVVQGDTTVTDAVGAGETKEFTTAVTADTEVYIGSFSDNLNFYGVKYVPGGTVDTPTVTDDPAVTDEPTVTDDPAVTDEPSTGGNTDDYGLTAVTADADWTFSDMIGADVTSQVLLFDNTMCVLGDEKMVIDESDKSIDNVSYTARLKMGGSPNLDENNFPTSKVLAVLPGVAGTLKIAFAHASGKGNARELVVVQGNTELGKCSVEPNSNTAYTVNVEANKPVYMYSLDGLNFYGVHFAAGKSAVVTPQPDATATPDAGTTDAPSVTPEVTVTTPPSADLNTVSSNVTWIFDNYLNTKWTSETVIGENSDLKVYATSGSPVEVDASNKKIDGIKYTTRLKFGGKAGLNADGTPSYRAVEFIPERAGKVTVGFAHASGKGEARTLSVFQNGAELAEWTVEPSELMAQTVEFAAGSSVYIYSKASGINVYVISVELEDATPAPTATPDPNVTPDPNATPTPVPEETMSPNLEKATADAEALTLRSISDYAVYIDLELVKKGVNGSTITWESSNEKYISIQDISSGGNYTGVVSRPYGDEDCDENGGVPVTLTATVTNGSAVVTREFNVSVRKFNPVYYNDFQADVDADADEEGGYKGIQKGIKAVNGDTFDGIRLTTLKDSKAIADYGFEHKDRDTEQYFDKRIMNTSAYGQPADPYGNTREDNYAFYFSMWNSYGGGTTENTLWIKLNDDETTSGYPEGIILMSMDINILSNASNQMNMGVGTSKPSQMCRFSLKKKGLRYGNDADEIDSGYTAPTQKWITATIVANTTTHLWDLYFDGMLVQKNIKFRNAQDFAATIEFTISRDSTGSKDRFLYDNIFVENITEDYTQAYWDALELEIPYDKEKEAYVASDSFLLYYFGLDGLAGNVYGWKSSNKSIINAGSQSYAVEDLVKFGYTEEQIQAYKDKGANYVTVAVADINQANVPAEGAYVTLTASMEIDGKVYSKDFLVYVTKSDDAAIAETDSEKALADIAAISSIKNGTTYTKAQNLNFEEKGAIYGSKFTWKSSNTSVISNDGDITRPKTSGTTKVTVTVTAEYGEAVETKKFTVYVKGTDSGSSSGGGGGGGGGGGLRVVGTVSDTDEKYVSQAYTPEQTSKMVFNDIENVGWAKEAIEELYKKGIVSGYGNDMFAPNYNVTREQFVKMLVIALDLSAENTTATTFADVSADAWYAEYINTAVALGIVNGKDASTFGVGEFITRQDMAVMCERALAVKGIVLENEAQLADSDKVSDYAKSAVSKMVAAGYITGDENGNFNPFENATRAQTAVVLYRIIK